MTVSANEKELRKLGEILFKSFTESMYLSGHITENDLDNKEKIYTLIKEQLDHPDGLYLIIDHRKTLQEKARTLSSTGDHELAVVVYAMFFEHSINGVIASVLAKRKISRKTKNEILRSANFKAKFTWVLELLNLPKFNEQHLRFILKLADQRNAFTHYKFNEEHADTDSKGPLIELIEGSERTAKYIKSYESRVLYQGNKGRIRKKLKKP